MNTPTQEQLDTAKENLIKVWHEAPQTIAAVQSITGERDMGILALRLMTAAAVVTECIRKLEIPFEETFTHLVSTIIHTPAVVRELVSEQLMGEGFKQKQENPAQD